MTPSEVLREMRWCQQWPAAQGWANAIEAAMREKDAEIAAHLYAHVEMMRKRDAEIERLKAVANRGGHLAVANAEIERLQRACVGAIRHLGLVKDPSAHQAEVLLRAALAEVKDA